jgi:hypothetical protein
MKRLILTLWIQFLEFIVNKTPLYLRQQYVHSLNDPTFKPYYTKENWDIYAKMKMEEASNRAYSKRLEFINSLDAKELKKQGISLAENGNINIDLTKCSADMVNKLNQLV